MKNLPSATAKHFRFYFWVDELHKKTLRIKTHMTVYVCQARTNFTCCRRSDEKNFSFHHRYNNKDYSYYFTLIMKVDGW